jgi:membrane-bound ClpP family serine protease
VVPGALAIAGKTLPAQALNWQAGALAVLLCLLTLWGLTIMLGKPGQQITWMVGNLSGLAICLFHLVRHAVDPRRYASLRPILLGLCAVAIMVDVGVFARVGWF